MKWIAAILFLLCASVAHADPGLVWSASTDTNVIGYKIYSWSTNSSGGYTTNCIDVGNVTGYTVTGLTANTIYYFAVKCYDAVHEYSAFSNVQTYATPVQLSLAAWPALLIPGVTTTDLLSWQTTNFCIVLPGAVTEQFRGFRFAAPQMIWTNIQP